MEGMSVCCWACLFASMQGPLWPTWLVAMVDDGFSDVNTLLVTYVMVANVQRLVVLGGWLFINLVHCWSLFFVKSFLGGLPLPLLVSFARKKLRFKNFHVRNECLGFWCNSYCRTRLKAHCVQPCKVFFFIHCDPVLQISSEMVCARVCKNYGCCGFGFRLVIFWYFKIEVGDRSYTSLFCWDLGHWYCLTRSL